VPSLDDDVVLDRLHRDLLGLELVHVQVHLEKQPEHVLFTDQRWKKTDTGALVPKKFVGEFRGDFSL
jgi:hypothetical protein